MSFSAYITQRRFSDDGVVTTLTMDNDGSKTRKRYHHGLIAQEVEDVVRETDIDFGGLQHHSVNGGNDVYSLGYIEFIGPLIKSVQELSNETRILKESIQELSNENNILKESILLMNQ